LSLDVTFREDNQRHRAGRPAIIDALQVGYEDANGDFIGSAGAVINGAKAFFVRL